MTEATRVSIDFHGRSGLLQEPIHFELSLCRAGYSRPQMENGFLDGRQALDTCAYERERGASQDAVDEKKVAESVGVKSLDSPSFDNAGHCNSTPALFGAKCAREKFATTYDTLSRENRSHQVYYGVFASEDRGLVPFWNRLSSEPSQSSIDSIGGSIEILPASAKHPHDAACSGRAPNSRSELFYSMPALSWLRDAAPVSVASPLTGANLFHEVFGATASHLAHDRQAGQTEGSNSQGGDQDQLRHQRNSPFDARNVRATAGNSHLEWNSRHPANEGRPC